MPGASLWLMPPKHHHTPHIPHHHPHLPLPGSLKKSHSRNPSHDIPKSHNVDSALNNLITTAIPSAFPGQDAKLPTFPAHVTLTSEIDLGSLKPNPAAWLERLAVPQVADVTVRFREVAVGQAFFKKLFLRCERGGLEGLAQLCRWQAVEGGAAGSGMENAERWVEGWDPHVSLMYSAGEVEEAKRKEVEELVLQSGVEFSGDGEMSGWSGGTLWLVPTEKPIEQWKPIAERKLHPDDDL